MEQLEQARIRYFIKTSLVTSLLVIDLVVLYCLEFALETTKVPINISIIILIMTVILSIITTYTFRFSKDYKNYTKCYKEYFVKKALEQIFTEVAYDHESGIPKEKIEEVGILVNASDYASNDYVSAKYKDVNFIQADVSIGQRQTELRTERNDKGFLFKGRWLEFDFPKKFNFNLELIEKGFISAKIPKSKNGREFAKYETESNAFNRKFNIYAEDGFEVYYILDPTTIERIEKVTASYQAKYLLFFNNNKLTVAIYDKKDAFEIPGPFRKINPEIETQKVASEIRLITDFVDYLRLDRKLFQEK